MVHPAEHYGAASAMPVSERLSRRALIVIALGGLAVGSIAALSGRGEAARWIWGAGIVPVAVSLLWSMIGALRVGRIGVDAVAFVSMTAAMCSASRWRASSWR